MKKNVRGCTLCENTHIRNHGRGIQLCVRSSLGWRPWAHAPKEAPPESCLSGERQRKQWTLPHALGVWTLRHCGAVLFWLLSHGLHAFRVHLRHRHLHQQHRCPVAVTCLALPCSAAPPPARVWRPPGTTAQRARRPSSVANVAAGSQRATRIHLPVERNKKARTRLLVVRLAEILLHHVDEGAIVC